MGEKESAGEEAGDRYRVCSERKHQREQATERERDTEIE